MSARETRLTEHELAGYVGRVLTLTGCPVREGRATPVTGQFPCVDAATGPDGAQLLVLRPTSYQAETEQPVWLVDVLDVIARGSLA